MKLVKEVNLCNVLALAKDLHSLFSSKAFQVVDEYERRSVFLTFFSTLNSVLKRVVQKLAPQPNTKTMFSFKLSIQPVVVLGPPTPHFKF